MERYNMKDKYCIDSTSSDELRGFEQDLLELQKLTSHA